jgi:Dockerin type I domain
MTPRHFILGIRAHHMVRTGSVGRLAAIVAFALAAYATSAAATCPLVDCARSTIPTVIVGSPRGTLVPYQIIVIDANSPSHAPIPGDTWLSLIQGDVPPCTHGSCDLNATIVKLFDVANGGQLKCTLENCQPNILWPYLDPGPARIGGHGAIYLQVEVPCPGCNDDGYLDVSCIEARSTDVNGDGNTDQTDKLAMGRAILSHTTLNYYDFNVDGAVTAADYNVLADEMAAEYNGGQPVPLYQCQGGTPVAVGNQSTFVPDASPPGSTSLCCTSNGGYSYTFSWTSPGDDTDDPAHNYQQLGSARTYDLRWSSSPITSSNFTSATAVPADSLPSPALAGTAQSVTLHSVNASAKYWAMRTQDHFGNWSAVGPCLQIFPRTISTLSMCSPYKDCMIVSWIAPQPWAQQSYDLRYSSSPITDECSYEGAWTFSAPSGQQGQINVDISGLSPGQTYYAAVRSRTSSTAPWSPISNIGSTVQPTTGPSCPGNVLCGGDGFAMKPVGTQTPSALEFVVTSSMGGGVSNDLRYGIPERLAGQPMRLEIFDVTGRRLATLANGISTPGSFSAHWDHVSSSGSGAGAGLYYARLRVGEEQLQRTIVVTP